MTRDETSSTAATMPAICALLRGESPAPPAPADDERIAAFLREARYHGVTPLLDARFNAMPGSAWPEPIKRACRDDARAYAIQEFAGSVELVRVLDALQQAGIRPLLLKGAALAYSHYANPAFRPRGDTDVLIPEPQVGPTASVLERLGYARTSGVTGALISYQADWSRRDGVAISHHLDVHWRINNSQILAKMLNYDELDARATALPALGPHARALVPVHALLLACIHRAGHASAPYFADGQAYLGGNRLIWLYDIHLLITRMSDAELAEFVALATSRHARAICLDALQACIERFATPVAPSVLAGLAHSGRREPAALYLRSGLARQMVGDFVALGGVTQRARWLKELAFPPAEYMRRHYPDSAARWLPVLYARRGLQGLWRLAKGGPADRHH